MKMINKTFDKMMSFDDLMRYREEQVRLNLKKLRLESNRINANIPNRFKHSTLDNLNFDYPQQQKVIYCLKNYVAQFKAQYEIGAGLIFVGKPGPGKTHIVAAIMNALLDDEHSVKYTKASNIYRMVRESFNKRILKTEQQIIRSFIHPELLIIDEIDRGCSGNPNLSDFERNLLFDVVNSRYEMSKPMIVISNQNVESLKTMLGNVIIDRLLEKSAVFAFDWPSYRTHKVECNNE